MTKIRTEIEQKAWDAFKICMIDNAGLPSEMVENWHLVGVEKNDVNLVGFSFGEGFIQGFIEGHKTCMRDGLEMISKHLEKKKHE